MFSKENLPGPEDGNSLLFNLFYRFSELRRAIEPQIARFSDFSSGGSGQWVLWNRLKKKNRISKQLGKSAIGGIRPVVGFHTEKNIFKYGQDCSLPNISLSITCLYS